MAPPTLPAALGQLTVFGRLLQLLLSLAALGGVDATRPTADGVAVGAAGRFQLTEDRLDSQPGYPDGYGVDRSGRSEDDLDEEAQTDREDAQAPRKPPRNGMRVAATMKKRGKEAKGRVKAMYLLDKHIAKLKTPVNGKLFGGIVAVDGDSFTLQIPGAGIQEVQKYELLGGMKTAGDAANLLGLPVELTPAQDGSTSAVVIAAGEDGGKTHILAKDGNGGIIMLNSDQYMTQKQIANAKAARTHEHRGEVADRIASGDHEFHGSELMSPEAWAAWQQEDHRSHDLRAKLNEEVGDSFKRADDAVKAVEDRTAHMQQLAMTASDGVADYGQAMAKKAKMFAQLEYKVKDLPLEGIEKALVKEDTRNAPLDEIRVEAEHEKKVLTHYNKFVRDLIENSEEFKDDMNLAYEAHFEDQVSSGERNANGTLSEDSWRVKKKAARDAMPKDMDVSPPRQH